MGNSVGAVVVVEIFMLPENFEEVLFSDEGGGVCGMSDQLHLLPTQNHWLGFDFISAEGWVLFP